MHQHRYNMVIAIFFELSELKQYCKLFWTQGEVGQLDHTLSL